MTKPSPSLKAADYDLQDPEQFDTLMNGRLDYLCHQVHTELKSSGVEAAIAVLTGVSAAQSVNLDFEIQKLQARINELEA